MASSFSTETLLELQGTGENGSTWGIKANTVFEIIDRSSNGVGDISLATATSGSTYTLTATNSTLADWQHRVLNFTDATTYVKAVLPGQKKMFVALNSATGAFLLDIFSGTATSGFGRLKQNEKGLFYNDGSDVYTVMRDFQFVADPSSGLGQDTGMISLTGAGTSEARTITGATGEIKVTNGDGVAGNPTISFATDLSFTEITLEDATLNNPTIFRTDGNGVPGSTYTLATGDVSSRVSMYSTGAKTVTIPDEASVSIPHGSTIPVYQQAGDTISFQTATGVDLYYSGKPQTRGLHSLVYLYKRSSDQWVLWGDYVKEGVFTTITATGGGSLTGTWTDLGSVTTIDINGGAVDGTVIGGSTPAAGTFTTLNATGGTLSDVTINGGTLTFGSNISGTGATIEDVLLSSPDIDGGTVDGAVIGGSTAAAGTFTTLNATGGGELTGTWSDLGSVTTVDINGGTLDNVSIGATTPAAAVVTTGRATAGRIINQSTATNYTLVLSDAGKTIEQSNSSANTITVPPNASVAYPVGADIAVVQTGTGVLSITEGAGVTVNSRGDLSDSAGQYAVMWLYKQATNTWILTGDLA